MTAGKVETAPARPAADGARWPRAPATGATRRSVRDLWPCRHGALPVRLSQVYGAT